MCLQLVRANSARVRERIITCGLCYAGMNQVNHHQSTQDGIEFSVSTCIIF